MQKWLRPTLLLFLALNCLSLSSFGQYLRDTIFVVNTNRLYDVQLPPNWTATDTLPLVLDLHYLGGDARDEDTLTQFKAVADTANFILCHPWGQGTNWNAGFNSPFLSGAADVLFIDQLIDSLHQQYNIDLRRVYVVGMGQGGFMAHRLACELDQRIAAIASVGASMADSTMFHCNSGRAMPIMLVNGTADSVINYNQGLPGFWPGIDSLVSFWVNHNGASGPIQTNLPDLVAEGSTITTFSYPGMDQSEILLYQVLNGGFSWPGASDSLPNSGIINQDINCAVEIWNFFNRFQLPANLVNRDISLEQPRFSISPNPFFQNFHLHASKFQTYRILNSSGQMVKSGSLEPDLQNHLISLDEQAKGLYFLVLQGDSGQSALRIIKMD